MYRPSPSPGSLADWLAVATRDLVPSAQARVRVEIEAHVTQAVQTHLKNGHSESEAMAAALADLGDAKTAAKRFGREFLTVKDTRLVFGLVKDARSVCLTVVFLLMFPNLTTLLFKTKGSLPVNYSGFWTVWMAFCYVALAGTRIAGHLLARHKVTPGILRWVHYLGTLSLLLLVALLVAQATSPSGIIFGLAIGVLVGLGYFNQRKLVQSVIDEGIETLPQNLTDAK